MEKLLKTTRSETMKIEDMNEGVQLILRRMETHPEEFEEGSSHMRWMQVISDVVRRVEHQDRKLPWLYDEEAQAIYNGIQDIQRNKFTAYVLRALTESNSFDTNDLQLDLPYMPPIPPMQPSIFLTKAEIETANKLGVSLEVFAESKRRVRQV